MLRLKGSAKEIRLLLHEGVTDADPTPSGPFNQRRKPMKSIRRIALAVALALIFVAGVNAQDTCRVKVLIATFNWNNADEYRKDFMSPNQTDWWLKDGKKKFPGVCITTEKNEADYLIAWTATESADKYTYTVPHTETTQHQGTVNTNSSSRSTSSPETVYSSGSGTYRGTSTTTTYERKDGEWPVVYVNAFVHRMTKDGSDKPYVKTPLFMTKHKGQWRWSKPDKDSFVRLLEFINKQLK